MLSNLGQLDCLVDGLALDVLDGVPGPDGHGDVGPGVPAPGFGAKGPGVVTLRTFYI